MFNDNSIVCQYHKQDLIKLILIDVLTTSKRYPKVKLNALKNSFCRTINMLNKLILQANHKIVALAKVLEKSIKKKILIFFRVSLMSSMAWYVQ